MAALRQLSGVERYQIDLSISLGREYLLVVNFAMPPGNRRNAGPPPLCCDRHSWNRISGCRSHASPALRSYMSTYRQLGRFH
jgi:hypothetical protein